MSAEQYIPIEMILARPRIRILRGLRFVDWIEPGDLFDLIGLVDSLADSRRDRDRHARGLASLLTDGAIERRVVDQPSKAKGAQHKRVEHSEYRITALGRELLRSALNSYEQRLGEGVAA